MPCAAGELCQLSNQTPAAPHGHPCRGGCGGRLHGICGEVAVEGEGEEMHRICHACLSSKQASTAAAGKRKAQDAGGILKRTNAGEGKKADRTAPRTRFDSGPEGGGSRRPEQEGHSRESQASLSAVCGRSRASSEHVMNQVRYSGTVLLYRRFTRVQDADTVLYCIHGCNMQPYSHHNRRSLLSV